MIVWVSVGVGKSPIRAAKPGWRGEGIPLKMASPRRKRVSVATQSSCLATTGPQNPCLQEGSGLGAFRGPACGTQLLLGADPPPLSSPGPSEGNPGLLAAPLSPPCQPASNRGYFLDT